MCGEFTTRTVKGIIEPVDITFVKWRDVKEPVRMRIEEMEVELGREHGVLSIGRQKRREDRPVMMW